jgi:hypothetical protein
LELLQSSERNRPFDWQRDVASEDWDRPATIDVANLHLVLQDSEGLLEHDVSEDHRLLPADDGGAGMRAPAAAGGAIRLMENASTGQFRAWRPPQVHHARIANQSPAKQLGNLVAEYEEFMQAQQIGTSGFWFFAQGLLAGFSISTIFMALSATTLENFLSDYSRVANETRRLLYILCSLSLIGAADSYFHARHPVQERTRVRARAGAKDWVSWKHRPQSEKALIVSIVAIYATVFAMTLLCTVGDVFMFYHNGSSSPGDAWIPLALSDGPFVARLRIW